MLKVVPVLLVRCGAQRIASDSLIVSSMLVQKNSRFCSFEVFSFKGLETAEITLKLDLATKKFYGLFAFWLICTLGGNGFPEIRIFIVI